MGIYIFTLIITYTLAALSTRYGTADENNPGFIKPNGLFVCLIILIFVGISGFRYMNDYLSDEWIYRTTYAQLAERNDFFSLFTEKEWGFAVFNWILSRFSANPQVMIFMLALITNLLIISTMAKYGRPFELSILLYTASGIFFASFNIIRQCLAMAILFWGIRYVLEGKFWKYFLLIVVAATLHTSAWLVLPVYFIVRQKKLTKWMLPLFAAALIIMANFQSAAGFLLADGTYSSYLSGIEQGGYGVNPLRVATSFLPLIMMILFKNRLAEIHPNNATFINFSIVSCIIMLISLVYVYLARIDVYFGIAGVLIIPQLSGVFKKRGYMIYGLMLMCYFLFGLYQASIFPAYHNILLEDPGGLY